MLAAAHDFASKRCTVNVKREDDAWPNLATAGWESTCRTMHMWSQIIGKTRLALAPMQNHWWQVPLYVSARGLTTSPMPVGARAFEFEVELDFISHRLEMRGSDGSVDSFALESGTLARFYTRYFAGLRRLGVDVKIHPRAVEIPDTIYLDRDEAFRPYDPDWAHRFFGALVRADRLLKEFRGGFLGKGSPVHFFWGSFDMAVTRFSGRSAPLHPGGAPNCPDYVMREAYSHEVSSAGFWPGDARFPEAVFYSYAYPIPPGLADAPVLPAAARYDKTLGEFLLPYEAVRGAASADREVSSFLETTYTAAADLAQWDRRAVERKMSQSDKHKEKSSDLRM
jgi:hypothetical protein